MNFTLTTVLLTALSVADTLDNITLDNIGDIDPTEGGPDKSFIDRRNEQREGRNNRAPEPESLEKPDPPKTDASGALTRFGALCAAREKLGEEAIISSDDALPRLVWVVGQFGATVGRGATWEDAINRARQGRKEEPREPVSKVRL